MIFVSSAAYFEYFILKVFNTCKYGTVFHIPMSIKTESKQAPSVIRKVLTENVINDIDEIISLLLSAGKSKNFNVVLKENDIQFVIRQSKLIIQNQPMLIETEGPMKICGDIHGQFTDLIYLIQICGDPSTTRYMFLGDYVDRGRQGIETITILLAYKIKYPNSFYLLRGNHESQAVSRVYGFYDECKRRFGIKLWKSFLDVFNCLPVAAILENQIFCCHGGLSPEMFKPDVTNLEILKDKIKAIIRPTDIPEDGLLCDLLWSDPLDLPNSLINSELHKDFFSHDGFAPNERGISYVFNPAVVDKFLKRFGLDLIIRAHQVVEDGYEFFANRSFITIFSAPNYCGEFDNAGAVFCLSRSIVFNSKSNDEEIDLEGSFKILFSDHKQKFLSTPVRKQK